jgi:hypothetical protein
MSGVGVEEMKRLEITCIEQRTRFATYKSSGSPHYPTFSYSCAGNVVSIKPDRSQHP